MNNEKVVFIFYTFEDSAKGSSWTYTNLRTKNYTRKDNKIF